MKKIIFIITLLSLLGLSRQAQAQFDTQLSHYWATPNYFNPAYAGQTNNLNVSALYRMQWIGIDGAPKNTLVLAEMPLNFLDRRWGVGITMNNESIGLFSNNVISAQLAWKKTLGKGTLGIGLQAGLLSSSFDGSKIYIPNDNDYHNPQDEAAPGSKVSDNTVDMGLGIFFSTKKLYLGLSATHLVTPDITFNDKYSYEIPRSYYFLAGYNIKLKNSLIELHPSILIKAVEPSSFEVKNDTLQINNTDKGSYFDALLEQAQIDVTLRASYNKKFWVGASWRKDDAAIFMIGANIKGVNVGYSFDYPLNSLKSDSYGSHELYLRYSIEMSKKKTRKNKHKSIRIL